MALASCLATLRHAVASHVTRARSEHPVSGSESLAEGKWCSNTKSQLALKMLEGATFSLMNENSIIYIQGLCIDHNRSTTEKFLSK